MAEFAATNLSLTPVPGTWQQVLARLEVYLKEQHRPCSLLPREGEQLLVDPAQQCIENRRVIDLREPVGAEPEGLQYWRSLPVEVWFDIVSDWADLAIREAEGPETWVELRLATRVHEGIFRYDLARRDFNAEAKAALVRMFITLTKALGGSGFGYRRGKENSLFGPLSIDSLRNYFENGIPQFENRGKLELKVAGLAASYIDETQFPYDNEEHPKYYRQSGFYLFDYLWPSK